MISKNKSRGFVPISSVALESDAGASTKRFLASFVRICFFDDVNLYWLISASCLILFASMWLMLSPGVIYSRAMTWDLLFNLEGAWQLYTGQDLHVDTHYPIGTLPFAITALGFQLVGIRPIAFVVGECVLATVFTVLAVLAVKDRLPILPGFLFVSMCVVLVLMPVTNGDELGLYTFATGYNRFGWSAVSILCLLLFIEPNGGRDPLWTDLAAGSALTFGLFYLKITYFGVALAAISLALLSSPHIRRHLLAWCAVLLLAIVIAFAPTNDGYRADIISAIASGRICAAPRDLVHVFVRNGFEESWVLAEIIVLLYLVSRRCAPLYDISRGLFIVIFGFLLTTQNFRAMGIPLYAILALLLYVRLGEWLRSARPSLMAIVCVMTCTLLPLLVPLLLNSLNLVGYNIKAQDGSQAFVVTTTNLQGLAVPAENLDAFDDVAAERYARDTISRIRAGQQSRLELSQHEYVKTILALADFLQSAGAAPARIVVIDQVSPLPFVLGATPPRGGNLWSGDVAWRPPEEALPEADYVAIPRFPTHRETLVEALNAYGEYLSSRFVQRYETPYWTVLKRRNAL